MKISRKFGLSYYTLDLDKTETAQWKATNNLPNFQKKIERKKIFENAFIRIKFGGTEGAMKALNALDSSLREFSQRISG